MLVCGFVYRTPMPVQPMKAAGAIATTQAAQTLTLTPAMVHGASLVTGAHLAGAGPHRHRTSRRESGEASDRHRHHPRPRLRLHDRRRQDDGAELVGRWRSAARHVRCCSTNRVIPAMFLLLLFGRCAMGSSRDPALLEALREVRLEPRLPSFALGALTLNDLLHRRRVPRPAAGAADARQRHHRDHRGEQPAVSSSSGQRGPDRHVDRPHECR